MTRLYTLTDIAEHLGIPRPSLYQNIRRLREMHGFPQPIPGLGHRYDPLAIEAWLAKWRGADDVKGKTSADVLSDADIARMQAEIDARADALGRKGNRHAG